MTRASGLSFEESGTGDAVLFIHGGIIAAAFKPLVAEPELASNYRCIRYDRMGMGDSDRQTISYTPADHARDAAALLRHLGIERAHVVGHSFGGVVALQLALNEPALVRSLVLIEPAVYSQLGIGGGDEMNRRIAALADLHRAGDSATAVDRFMTGAEGPEWRRVEETIPGALAQAERDAPANFEADIPNLFAWEFGDEQASQIRCPVLYLIGGGRARQTEAAEAFTARVTQTRTAVVPDALHSLHHQRTQEVAAAIREFLTGQEA